MRALFFFWVSNETLYLFLFCQKGKQFLLKVHVCKLCLFERVFLVSLSVFWKEGGRLGSVIRFQAEICFVLCDSSHTTIPGTTPNRSQCNKLTLPIVI